MKTLTNIKTEVKDGKFTITGDVVERTFNLRFVQQVTVGHMADKNPHHIRHVQLSHEAMFIRLPIGPSIAIPVEDLVINIGNVVEPKMSYAAKLKPSKDRLKVEFDCEIEPDLQWQAAEPGKDFANIPGETKPQMGCPISGFAKGSRLRCVASSEAGTTVTPEVTI